MQQHRHLPTTNAAPVSVAALLGTANVPFCGKSTPQVVSWAVMRYQMGVLAGVLIVRSYVR